MCVRKSLGVDRERFLLPHCALDRRPLQTFSVGLGLSILIDFPSINIPKMESRSLRPSPVQCRLKSELFKALSGTGRRLTFPIHVSWEIRPSFMGLYPNDFDGLEIIHDDLNLIF